MTTDSRRARPTIIDVAREAGVSKSLVSLAIGDRAGVSRATREHILEVAERLGYRSNTWARSLARGRSRLVGIVLNDLHSGYHTDVVEGVEDAAAEAGYSVLLGHGRRDSATVGARIDAFAELGVDGVVVITGHVDEAALARAARARPVVVVGRPDRVPEGVGQVHNDDRMGARAAVHHLAALGHRRIAHLTASTRTAARDRRAAYEATMHELGLSEYREVIDAAHADALLARVRDGAPDAPTAVFARNDRVAADVLSRAIDAGIPLPERLSVVGYDDTMLASLVRPALTSVDQPRARMGRAAFAQVISMLGGGIPTREVIAPSLVVRGSTTPALAWVG